MWCFHNVISVFLLGKSILRIFYRKFGERFLFLNDQKFGGTRFLVVNLLKYSLLY